MRKTNTTLSFFLLGAFPFGGSLFRCSTSQVSLNQRLVAVTRVLFPCLHSTKTTFLRFLTVCSRETVLTTTKNKQISNIQDLYFRLEMSFVNFFQDLPLLIVFTREWRLLWTVSLPAWWVLTVFFVPQHSCCVSRCSQQETTQKNRISGFCIETTICPTRNTIEAKYVPA